MFWLLGAKALSSSFLLGEYSEMSSLRISSAKILFPPFKALHAATRSHFNATLWSYVRNKLAGVLALLWRLASSPLAVSWAQLSAAAAVGVSKCLTTKSNNDQC
eukprot:GHVP01045587.1.p1 GENE.GHVP01045587.1~~GHVP01045587.1.p1  ORF type:complete len:104 (-),score=3.19 GHVP01045587.1:66-377(-)